MNKFIITGNTGKDVEMRFMPNGEAVANFSVAVQDGWGEKKKTMWWKVSVFGKQAESVNKFLHKGDKVLVEGRVTSNENGEPRIWMDKQNEAHATFEMTGTFIEFLGGKQESNEEPF